MMTMMTMKNSLFGALVASSVALNAWAAPPPKGLAIRSDTAGELADLCSAKEQVKTTFCQGFAQGAISLKRREAGDTKPFCFPTPTPTRTQTMSQFAAWVQAKPERRALDSTAALFAFLGERFPCK
jgi:hypothetical protein